jgi:co-chaperonin GroES (HSP10)
VNKDDYIAQHFPEVECGARPTGNQILVQLRTVRKKSSGGIILAEATKEFNQSNTQVTRLAKVGHIAFKHRESGEQWKEGAWAEVGDVVIMPKYGGFVFQVPIPGTDDKATFALYNDYDVKLVVEGNFEAFDQIL